MSTSKRAKASSSPDQTALDQETSTGIHTDEIQVLCTADNTTITLPFAMAKMSNVLAACIEDVDNAGSAPFPITHVTGNTLMVCKAYLGIDDACAASDYLSSFGSSQEKLKDFLLLTQAASYLDIGPLLDVCCKQIATFAKQAIDRHAASDSVRGLFAGLLSTSTYISSPMDEVVNLCSIRSMLNDIHAYEPSLVMTIRNALFTAFGTCGDNPYKTYLDLSAAKSSVSKTAMVLELLGASVTTKPTKISRINNVSIVEMETASALMDLTFSTNDWRGPEDIEGLEIPRLVVGVVTNVNSILSEVVDGKPGGIDRSGDDYIHGNAASSHRVASFSGHLLIYEEDAEDLDEEPIKLEFECHYGVYDGDADFQCICFGRNTRAGEHWCNDGNYGAHVGVEFEFNIIENQADGGGGGLETHEYELLTDDEGPLTGALAAVVQAPQKYVKYF